MGYVVFLRQLEEAGGLHMALQPSCPSSGKSMTQEVICFLVCSLDKLLTQAIKQLARGGALVLILTNMKS